MDQNNRPAPARVGRTGARIMLRNALGEVPRYARIERLVRTPDNVDAPVVHFAGLRKRSVKRSLSPIAVYLALSFSPSA